MRDATDSSRRHWHADTDSTTASAAHETAGTSEVPGGWIHRLDAATLQRFSRTHSGVNYLFASYR